MCFVRITNYEILNKRNKNQKNYVVKKHFYEFFCEVLKRKEI